MADIPPVSDPQIAALIEQNKKRRTRGILIFVVVGLVLVVGLGGSAVFSSVQSKKKRNVAYSRVIKCLFGKPLDAGEAPMTRVRSAWRARILAADTKGDHDGDPVDQETKDTAEWPNRCVAQMIAFTDTLKDIGEMREGDKDLGFYSRELSKQTAGQSWKNVDTYQAAVESFMTEAQKGSFEFVDVPDVKAPDLADAQSIDKAFPKSCSLEDTHLDANAHNLLVATAARFYAPAGKGKPAELCMSSDGKELTCTPMAWLPPEASGIPWVLSSDDGAPPLMAFGRNSGIADGSSVSTGVFRSNDGAALLPGGGYYVAGGSGRIDGSSMLLLKAANEPQGDHFQIAHISPGTSKLQLDPATLTDWNESPKSVAMIGPYVLWVTSSDQLKARNVETSPHTPSTADETVATLPGPLSFRKPPFTACRTKSALYVGVRTVADGIGRMVVLSGTDAGFGKPQVVGEGDLSCTSDAAVILDREEISTCTEAGCTTAKLVPELSRDEPTIVLGGTGPGSVLVRASKPSGLLRIAWQKDGKTLATKVYDAQMKGTVLLGEAKLGRLDLVGRRDYGLVFLDIGGTQHVARVDATGILEPVAVKL
jgi:hypothetical protein